MERGRSHVHALRGTLSALICRASLCPFWSPWLLFPASFRLSMGLPAGPGQARPPPADLRGSLSSSMQSLAWGGCRPPGVSATRHPLVCDFAAPTHVFQGHRGGGPGGGGRAPSLLRVASGHWPGFVAWSQLGANEAGEGQGHVRDLGALSPSLSSPPGSLRPIPGSFFGSA